ncbi:unnamed protein product [Toxocara canis]|uniref:Transmembrane protein n=1 Tax=Toxocara canis TaxID=6265 RepID=A0A183UJ81_TOXCA|nr:unnamed protein product [Toxocara canis]
MEVHELDGEPLKANGSLQIGFTINISLFHRRIVLRIIGCVEKRLLFVLKEDYFLSARSHLAARGASLTAAVEVDRKKHLSECWIEGNSQHGNGKRRKYFLRRGYSEIDEFGDDKCRVQEVEEATSTVMYGKNATAYKKRTRKRFEVSLRVGWSALPEGRPNPVRATTIYPLFIRCALSDAHTTAVTAFFPNLIIPFSVIR